LIINKLQSSFL